MGRTVDLTGQRFGKLVAVEDSGERKNGEVVWRCQCDCGSVCLVKASKLRNGRTKSCGCLRRGAAPNRNDLAGRRFGRLTALYPVKSDLKTTNVVWHCRCDCGREVDVRSTCLAKGITRSCGCLVRENTGKIQENMHYRDDTCLEMLERAQRSYAENKAGFRGLFLTKQGKYRVMIAFRKVHYNLGYYMSFEEAVKVRLNAEQQLHAGYIEAYKQYQEKAVLDPEWAAANPFYYDVRRVNGEFAVSTTRL